MDITTLKHIGYTIIGMVGGASALLHIGLKFAPDVLKALAVFGFNKYPSARHWVAIHGADIVAGVRELEKINEDIVSQAQKDDSKG